MNNHTVLEQELRELNRRYHAGNLLPSEFEKQMRSAGVDQLKSLLVEVFPDGCNTYVGVLISQNKVVFEFDVDLDDVNASEWVDITDEFMKKIKNTHSKKNREKIAYKLFLEVNSSD